MNNQPEAEPKGAARVGMELRQVRERLGWRLADVAAELRIRLPYLEAIERGELSALPGAAYQTGFVRTYSQALGLDGDEILRRFRAEGTGFVPKAELSFLAPVPDRAVPTGAIVLLGVVVILVGYGLWYRHTEQAARLAAQIPAVPMELAPLAVPAPMKPVAKPVAVTPPAPAQTATAGNSAPSAAPGAVPSVASPPAPPAGTPVSAPVPVVPPVTAVTIQATADSWVQVKDANGNILFSKTMHQGDSWPVPNLPGLVLTAGNAGATMLADNGKAGAPLGSLGTVLRNYALTAPAPGTGAPQGTPAGTPAGPPTAAAPATVPPKPSRPALQPAPVHASVPAPSSTAPDGTTSTQLQR